MHIDMVDMLARGRDRYDFCLIHVRVVAIEVVVLSVSMVEANRRQFRANEVSSVKMRYRHQQFIISRI